MSNYDLGMEQNKANYIPLTPLSFLDRIKDVYPDYEAIVYKNENITGNRSMIDVHNLRAL